MAFFSEATGAEISTHSVAWGIDEGLITPDCKKKACYNMLHRAYEKCI